MSSLKSSRLAMAMAVTLVATGTALLPPPLFAAEKPASKNYMDLYNQARAALAKGDSALAEEKVLAALAINPQHPGSIALYHQLQEAAPKADIIGSKYNAVKIPLVEFKDATVQSCFEYLKQQASALTDGKTQVNFVYNLTPEVLTGKRVSLRLQNVPFITAVDYICQLAGAEKRLEKYAIVIAEYGRASAPTEVDNKEVLPARVGLRSLVLQAVEFKDTPVADAFNTLRELATKDSGGAEQPNIILALAPEQSASMKVNLDLKNVPFFEALRLMCEHLDVQWKVGTYAITISPQPKAAEPSITDPVAPAEKEAVNLLNSGESSLSGIGEKTSQNIAPGAPLMQ